MRKQLGVFAICGALLMFTSGAFAQSYGPPPPTHGQAHHNSKASHHQGMYEQGRQQGWYKKGGRVPSAYRGNRYVVTNWRAAHLRQPPRGYHWVRSNNGDFLLVAVTTGVIASIIAHAVSH
ncbi:MAG: RcnB family protein [Rhodanobacteraceae bacterium]